MAFYQSSMFANALKDSSALAVLNVHVLWAHNLLESLMGQIYYTEQNPCVVGKANVTSVQETVDALMDSLVLIADECLVLMIAVIVVNVSA
jgi:hypothetical protein